MTGNISPHRIDAAESCVTPSGVSIAESVNHLRPVPARRPARPVAALFFVLLASTIGASVLASLNHYAGGEFLQMTMLAIAVVLGALVGGGVVWWRLRRTVRRAQLSAESLRTRLMSVERNQALWVSLSAVLHDVRNPLHNVSLLMETLGAPGADIDKIRKQVLSELERIHVRVRRVAGQVSDFLEIERRPVVLSSVYTEIEGMIAPLLKQSGTTFVFSCPDNVKVMADPKFLVQAVDHLLLNSLQILTEQPADRPRRLSVATMCEGERVILCIEDSGPGLPTAVRNNPFEPMVVGVRTTGMGIGLTIAHALARAAGGELAVSRTDDSGTQFHLRLVAA